jgi:glycine/D-amino acid oxidase-like deaminating enzyme
MAVRTFSVFDGTGRRAVLPRVAIIGAGVAGLGIGWRLADAACRVTVFERGEAGHGASWAAAGMLAAGLEAEPGEERLLALNLAIQRLWPAFRNQLEAVAGTTIGYRARARSRWRLRATMWSGSASRSSSSATSVSGSGSV